MHLEYRKYWQSFQYALNTKIIYEIFCTALFLSLNHGVCCTLKPGTSYLFCTQHSYIHIDPYSSLSLLDIAGTLPPIT